MKELTINAIKRLPESTLIKYAVSDTSFGYFKIDNGTIYFNCVFNSSAGFKHDLVKWMVADWDNYWIASKEEYCLCVLEYQTF
jgi:hypothetical protein